MTTEHTVENLVAESREALLKAGLKPPYILAPHFYSGIEAIWWANSYPNEIKVILGIDMVFPNMALAQAKEIPENKKLKEGHTLYTSVPLEMAETFKTFMKKIS